MPAESSLLDFVQQDAGDLTRKVGMADKRKLDEYFTAVRDIELRMQRAEKLPEPKVPDGVVAPEGIPAEYQEHIRMMSDLMVLAFQADITRVCTFVFANEGSNKPYPFINIRDGHHDLSHHGGDEAKKAKIREINKFHTTQLAYLLDRLKAHPRRRRQPSRSLHDRLRQRQLRRQSPQPRRPADPAGRPRLRHDQTGPAYHFPATQTPVNNLWVSMLDRVKAGVDILGDSTGRLAGLAG